MKYEVNTKALLEAVKEAEREAQRAEEALTKDRWSNRYEEDDREALDALDALEW